MALDWLPILPDGRSYRRPQMRDDAVIAEPLVSSYTPAPDLLASLTFFPCLPEPRPRVRRALQAVTIFFPFDVPTVIAPDAWLPILPMPTPRVRRARQEQDTFEPSPSVQPAIAARMGWAPTCPPVARRHHDPRVAVTLHDPFLVPPTGCVDLIADGYTSPDLIAEALTGTDLIQDALTSPDLIMEGVC